MNHRVLVLEHLSGDGQPIWAAGCNGTVSVLMFVTVKRGTFSRVTCMAIAPWQFWVAP